MKKTDSHILRGIIFTIAGGIMWGFSGACGQYLFTRYSVDSGWLTAVRMLCAGIALTLLAFRKQRENFSGVWKNPKDGLQVIIFGIFGLLFCQFSYLTAISYSNAGTATVLQYLGPVLILFFVCLCSRRLPNIREIVAVTLAVLGTFLLATHGNPSTMVLSRNGLIWGLISAVSLACYTLLPTRVIPKWGSLVVTGFGMLIGGIAMTLLVQVWRIPVVLDRSGWLAVAAIVIIGTIIAYPMYLRGIADIGPVKGSMLASIEPVSATLFSVFWLHTDFQPMDFVGFVCIMTTIFLLTKRETRTA